LLKIFKARIELRKLALEWEKWCKRVASAAKEILGSCEVYVFGSVAEGENTGGSDVDILVVCDKLPERNKERGELKAKIEEKAGLPLYHPFEIHLVDKREAGWYFRHSRKVIKIL